tara:strand:+ start:103 stop:429 length:327 start_codon:yes stop_codon:yes gene_type:complete
MNTVRKICEIEGVTYDRAVAHDLDNLERYPSKSKEKDLNILDMNLGHVLRSFSKTLAENKELKDELENIKMSPTLNLLPSSDYKRGWNTCFNQVKIALTNTDLIRPLE